MSSEIEDMPDWGLGLDTEVFGSEYDQLPVTDVGDLHGVDIPAREFLQKPWMPSKTVTLFAGDPGVGKSLFAQQALQAQATAAQFVGLRFTMTPTLYINCEDDQDELDRRSAAMADALKTPLSHAKGQAFTLSRLGMSGNELGTFDAAGIFEPSPFFRQIEQTCLRHCVRSVGLDNVAHMYAGNENVRGHVTQFLNACAMLALKINGHVLMIGHPAKSLDSQYSGSTAWEANVRSRWYLQRPEGDDGELSNDRILTREKSNYAAKGASITMTWQHGAFVPYDASEAFGVPEMAGRDNAIFLDCLAAATAQRRSVSHSPNAGTYAPKVFARMVEAKRLKVSALQAAMERLFGLGKIEADKPLWRRENRTWIMGIAVAESAHGSVCPPVHNGSTQPIEIACTPVHASVGEYINISGGHSGLPASGEDQSDELLDWSPR